MVAHRASNSPSDASVLVTTTHRDDFVQGKLGDEVAGLLKQDVDVAQFDEIEFLLNDKIELLWRERSIFGYEKVVMYGGVGRLLRITHPLAYALRSADHDAFTSGAEHFRGLDKLSQNMYFAHLGLRIPKTYFAAPKTMVENAQSVVGFPLILKDILASRGERNYLIRSQQELESNLAAMDEDRYLIQEYIENDGDIRVLINKEGDYFAFRRKAQTGSHLNNTSAGGSAEELGEIPDELKQQCMQILEEFKLPISGIDVIEHDGEFYFLEANTQPQIFTGEHVSSKQLILMNAVNHTSSQD